MVEMKAQMDEEEAKRLRKEEKRRLKKEQKRKMEEMEEKEEKRDKKEKKKKRKNEEASNEVGEKKAKNESESNDVDECIFKKKFYKATKHTKSLDEERIKAFYEEHNIQIHDSLQKKKQLKPILRFEDANLDERSLNCCSKFKTPTPIQSISWPWIASGRDVIGIAETGSGKTLAFSVPALTHMLYRKENPIKGLKGLPMMLVLAPTRELAMQSQEVLEEAGKSCGITSVCLYGGVSKFEQRKGLKAKASVIVATPGRLLDLMEEGVCDLSGISYLVLDEADRMLDQGFERAIRAIIAKTHKDRQTCLFSATWPEAIRTLAADFLKDPVRLTIGSEDLAAGKKVTQIVEVVDERGREFKLHNLLRKYHDGRNKILVFVLYKKEAERILHFLSGKSWNATGIHGDKSQEARIQALNDFKSGKIPILVATDVAARGLDIPNVEYVINHSFPLTIEDYVHRIGRTGRAGKSGTAHTFFHAGDKLRAGELVNVLKESSQKVPEEMYQFDLNVKRKEHKLYGSFGPKNYGEPMKKATKIKFD